MTNPTIDIVGQGLQVLRRILEQAALKIIEKHDLQFLDRSNFDVDTHCKKHFREVILLISTSGESFSQLSEELTSSKIWLKVK